MDHTLVSALAALGGAAIVAAVSFLRSWLVHQGEVRAQWVTQQAFRRQDLYKEFIEEASKCYLHALQHHEPDISLLVTLYAKMSRMRVFGSPRVLAAAEAALRRIIEAYSETDVTFNDMNLQTMVRNGSLDLLHDFSEACRLEADVFGQAIWSAHRRASKQQALCPPGSGSLPKLAKENDESSGAGKESHRVSLTRVEKTPADGTLATYCNDRDWACPVGRLDQTLHAFSPLKKGLKSR
jgi:hypothetical protein